MGNPLVSLQLTTVELPSRTQPVMPGTISWPVALGASDSALPLRRMLALQSACAGEVESRVASNARARKLAGQERGGRIVGMEEPLSRAVRARRGRPRAGPTLHCAGVHPEPSRDDRGTSPFPLEPPRTDTRRLLDYAHRSMTTPSFASSLLTKRALIGMIHVGALPGTPAARAPLSALNARARAKRRSSTAPLDSPRSRSRTCTIGRTSRVRSAPRSWPR